MLRNEGRGAGGGASGWLMQDMGGGGGGEGWGSSLPVKRAAQTPQGFSIRPVPPPC